MKKTNKIFRMLILIAGIMLVFSMVGCDLLEGLGNTDDPDDPNDPDSSGNPSAPGAVSNFTATPGNGQVVLTWSAPSNNGGSAVTGYEVTRDNWSNKETKTAGETSHTYTGLTNDTQYTFKVRARNAQGTGTESTATATPNVSTAIDANWLDGNNWTIGTLYAVSSYTISNSITVPADKTLTIRPGTTITFTKEAIGITVNGTIKAEGLPILLNADGGQIGTTSGYITLTKPAGDKWSGITINSNTGNVLAYTKIINAGENYYNYANSSSLYINNGSASITNCEIDGSGSNGITLTGNTGYLSAFENNTIKNSVKAPVFADSTVYSLRSISANNTYTDNAENYIRVGTPGTLTASMTLKKLNVYYRFDSDLNVNGDNAALTVEPGTEIRFDVDDGINVSNSAAIIMDGTATECIVLRGVLDTGDAWQGININSNRTESKLNFVTISRGGYNYYNYTDASSLYIQQPISVTNCIIEGSASNGITLTGSNAHFTEFANNTISTSTKAPIYVDNNIYALRNIGEGNTFVFTGDQSSNYVHINTSNTLENNMTLKALDIPYYLPSGLNINKDQTGVTLTIEPGTQVWVGNDKHITVNNLSKLDALGTEDKPITFRGRLDQAGYWSGILVKNGSHVRIANAAISGGGYSYYNYDDSLNNLYIENNGTAELLNVTITKSSNYGVGYVTGYKLWSSNVTFTDCAEGNVRNHTYGSVSTSTTLPANNYTPANPLQ